MREGSLDTVATSKLAKFVGQALSVTNDLSKLKKQEEE